MIMHVETKEFDEVIKEGIVLVDFYANWCGPCKMLAPILEEFSKSRPDIKIVKVDVDAQTDLSNMFNIMSIPTLILFKDQRILSTKQGFMSMDMLTEWINQVK
jgi:thioredoxin 1